MIPHRSGLSVPRGAVAAVIGLAVVTAVAAILRGGMELRHVPEILPLVAFYALVIAIGEYYRFRFEDSRDLAPMSLAAALALVLLSRSGTHDLVGLQPSPLLAAVALGLTLGALPRLLLGQDVRVDEVSARFEQRAPAGEPLGEADDEDRSFRPDDIERAVRERERVHVGHLRGDALPEAELRNPPGEPVDERRVVVHRHDPRLGRPR